MVEAVFLSFVTAAIAFTVAEMKIFRSLREWVTGKSAFFGELISCGFCLGIWIAFALVAVYKPRLFDAWPPLDYFLTALAIGWLSGLQWILMCCLTDKAGK